MFQLLESTVVLSRWFQIDSTLAPPYNPDVGELLVELAELHEEDNNRAQALKCYDRALNIYRGHYGSGSAVRRCRLNASG